MPSSVMTMDLALGFLVADSDRRGHAGTDAADFRFVHHRFDLHLRQVGKAKDRLKLLHLSAFLDDDLLVADEIVDFAMLPALSLKFRTRVRFHSFCESMETAKERSIQC